MPTRETRDETQRGERAVHALRLRAERVVRVERAVGLAVSQQIDRVRRVPLGRERRGDGAPQKARGAEAVDEHDLLATVPVALDVQGAGTGGNPKYVRFDGRASVLERDVQCRAGMLVN